MKNFPLQANLYVLHRGTDKANKRFYSWSEANISAGKEVFHFVAGFLYYRDQNKQIKLQ